MADLNFLSAKNTAAKQFLSLPESLTIGVNSYLRIVILRSPPLPPAGGRVRRNKFCTMEILLHYIWKHRIYPLHKLTTTDGETVEVIDPGLHNGNAGPDFFNAKVKVDGVLWVGNVEIHEKASDWFLHRHDKDGAYDNVVLHVVGTDDMPVVTSRGERVKQMVMDVPDYVERSYRQLLMEDRFPPCHSIVPKLSRLTLHSWMSALQAERLEMKTAAIMKLVKDRNGSWEDAFFCTLARNFGFGVNGEAFGEWAAVLSLNSVAHHRDDIFQVEAMFLGQAGLLNLETMSERKRQEAEGDGYFHKLSKEYAYLSHKFGLAAMDGGLWKFLRLRPQNFPYIRISQLANLYCNRRAGLSQIAECESVKELQDLFFTRVTPYWETHYTFGCESKRSEKRLSKQSINIVILNTVIPVLFAYGRYKNDESLCDRAFRLLEDLKAEDNSVTRLWQECGLEIKTAADSQAVVQLKKMYCDHRDCLRCRIGYEFIKDNGWFVKEECR